MMSWASSPSSRRAEHRNRTASSCVKLPMVEPGRTQPSSDLAPRPGNSRVLLKSSAQAKPAVRDSPATVRRQPFQRVLADVNGPHRSQSAARPPGSLASCRWRRYRIPPRRPCWEHRLLFPKQSASATPFRCASDSTLRRQADGLKQLRSQGHRRNTWAPAFSFADRPAITSTANSAPIPFGSTRRSDSRESSSSGDADVDRSSAPLKIETLDAKLFMLTHLIAGSIGKGMR